MACCNYVKCKNRNRTSNLTHACQMESVSPPSKSRPAAAPDRTPTGHSAVSFGNIDHSKAQPSPRVKQGVLRGYCGSFLSETKEKAILLSGESPTRRRKGCCAVEAGWKAGEVPGEVPGAVQLTLPGCYALSQTKSSFGIA